MERTTEGFEVSPNEFMDLVRAILMILDSEGKVLWINKYGLDFFGFPEEEIVGRSVYETIVPLEDSRGRDLSNLFKGVLENGGDIVPRINENIKKDGSRVWVYWTNRVLRDGSGKPVSIISAGIDMTSEVMLEAEKRRTFELSKSLIKIYSLFFSHEATFKEISQAVLEETKRITRSKHGFILTLGSGLAAQSTDGKACRMEEVHRLRIGEDGKYAGLLGRALNTREGFFTNSLEDLAFTGFPVEHLKIEKLMAVPAMAGEKAVGLIVLANPDSDYTEADLRSASLIAQYFALAIIRKQEEERIKRSETFYRALFDRNPIPTFTIQEGDTIVQVNGAFERTFGYRKEEVEGKMTWKQLVHPKDLPRLEGYRNARLSGKPAPPSYEATALDKFGNELQVLVSVALEKESVIAVVNLTRLKRLERELLKKKEELEAYTKHLGEIRKKSKELLEKERLAAIGEAATMVGHDLRNPLQAITNLCYLIEEQIEDSQGDQSQLKEMVTKIVKNIKYMDKIVADLQDFSKPVFEEKCRSSLRSILDDAMFGIDLPENVLLELNVRDADILLPAKLIIRVLKNLVINAIQAMPKGGKLTLSAGVSGGHVVFSVSDTGVGIPEEVKLNLFRPFYSTKPKGTGLGLSVVKKIVDHLGGSVEVESEECKGTTFRIVLPIPQ